MRPSFATPGRWLGVAALAVALAAPALAQRTVTLHLNTATLPDTLAAAATAGLQVRGCLEGCTGDQSALPGGDTIAWNDNTTLRPTNDGGDYWSVTFQIPDDVALNYKFYSQQAEDAGLGGWEDGNNHSIAAGTGDVTRELHYFVKGADPAYDWRPFEADGDSVAVWLRVYINTDEAVNKGLDLDDDALQVGVRGAPEPGGKQGAGSLNWDTTGILLTRESTDATRPGYALFSGPVTYPASAIGTEQAYKFFFSDGNTAEGWENGPGGGNRTFMIPAQDSTLHWVFYGPSPAAEGTAVTANVTFQVDVAPLTSIGLFQTGQDVVQVRGGFNGWDCPDDNQDDCGLGQDVVVPTTYVNQIPIRSLAGGEQPYKFYIGFLDENGDPQFTDASGTAIEAGWEEPLDTGGSDRVFTFSGSEQDLGTQFFNSIRSGNVIPEGTSVDVMFRVDMNPAMAYADAQGRAFDPSKDTVTVQFEDVVWLLTQDYIPGSDALINTGSANAIAGFQLTDPDSDGIYTGSLTVDGPSYNALAYRYVFFNATDGYQTEGQGGYQQGRRRYRYITDTSSGSFTLPYDVFRPANQPVPWAVNPTGTFTEADFSNAIATGANDPLYGAVIANEGGPGRSGELALGAAYPNPTSGIARMRLSLAGDEAVTVRVFDVTGRLVATVVEDARVRDAQVLEVDTQALAAGLYVVRAEAGGDVVTRRLTVIR